MPFVRDTVPRRGGVRDLQAYLERTLERLDDWTREIDDRLTTLERLQAITGIQIRYLWEDTFDVGIPAPSGFVKANENLMQNATQFAQSRFDEFGRLAIAPDIFNIPFSSGIYQVQDFNNNETYLYELTGPTIQRETDIVLNVVVIEALGPNPAQGDQVEVSYWPVQPDAGAQI